MGHYSLDYSQEPKYVDIESLRVEMTVNSLSSGAGSISRLLMTEI